MYTYYPTSLYNNTAVYLTYLIYIRNSNLSLSIIKIQYQIVILNNTEEDDLDIQLLLREIICHKYLEQFQIIIIIVHTLK